MLTVIGEQRRYKGAWRGDLNGGRGGGKPEEGLSDCNKLFGPLFVGFFVLSDLTSAEFRQRALRGVRTRRRQWR